MILCVNANVWLDGQVIRRCWHSPFTFAAGGQHCQNVASASKKAFEIFLQSIAPSGCTRCAVQHELRSLTLGRDLQWFPAEVLCFVYKYLPKQRLFHVIVSCCAGRLVRLSLCWQQHRSWLQVSIWPGTACMLHRAGQNAVRNFCTPMTCLLVLLRPMP